MGYGWRSLWVVLGLALVCRWGVAQIGPRYVIEVAAAGHTPVATQGQVQAAGKGLVLIRFQGLAILAVAADAEAYSEEAVRGWPAADLLLVLPARIGRYEGMAPLRAVRDGLPVIVSEPMAGAVAATAPLLAASTGGPTLYPMQGWDAMELRKQSARLRVTAMAGPPGPVAVAGYLLEVGNGRVAYRVYLSCVEEEGNGLAQRLPGADLAVLPAAVGPRLLVLNRGQPAHAEPAALTAAGYGFKALRR